MGQGTYSHTEIFTLDAHEMCCRYRNRQIIDHGKLQIVKGLGNVHGGFGGTIWGFVVSVESSEF